MGSTGSSSARPRRRARTRRSPHSKRAACFLDEQGLGCRAQATTKGEFACYLLNSSDVSDVSRWRDSSCQQRLYRFLGNDAAANAQSIARLRRVARLDDQSYELLSFETYSGPSYESKDTECLPAEPAASLLLDVDRRAALPRFTRVQR